MGLSVDKRMKMSAFDFQLRSRRGVGLFAKTRQSFKPVQLPSSTLSGLLPDAFRRNLAASSKRAVSLTGLNGRPI
jgi:hypothetical protein